MKTLNHHPQREFLNPTMKTLWLFLMIFWSENVEKVPWSIEFLRSTLASSYSFFLSWFKQKLECSHDWISIFQYFFELVILIVNLSDLSRQFEKMFDLKKKLPLRVTKIQFYSFLLFWSEIRNCHKDSLLSLFWEAKEMISFLPIFWRSATILTCILHFLNNSLLNFNGSGISKMSVFANLLKWQITLALLSSFSSLAPNSNRKTSPI